MSCMSDITLTSLVAAVTPRTGKINKNGLSVFERGENLLQKAWATATGGHGPSTFLLSNEFFPNQIFLFRKSFISIKGA